jgi:hypothetical protein
VVAAAAVLLLTRGTAPPATHAAQLVPANALLYVHASTDPDREPDRRFLAMARRLPALAPLARGYDPVRPWLGDEAGFFVVPHGWAVVLSVRDPKAANAAVPWLRRLGGRVAPAAGFLVAGTPAAVDSAVVLARHVGQALDAPTEDLPDDRVLDAYAAPEAGGLLPAALRFLAGRPLTASAAPIDGGVRVTVTRLGGAGRAADFEPRLLRALPLDTYAYAGMRGLPPVALPAVVAPLKEILDGELGLSIAPGTDEPVVTLVADVSDPAAARETLAGLQGTVAAALTGSGEATGQVPVFEERSIGGHDGYLLRLSGGGGLVYAVSGHRVAVSTRVEGVARALRDADGLDASPTFKSAVNGVPDTAQALAFVASDQLLELADESGLDAAEAYRAVRPNLARTRALGAVVRRQGNDTIAELTLLIP